MKFPFVLALALMLIGCATTQIKGRTDLLEFLVDGKTTKEEAMIKLGQPAGEFEKEKIFTYRLGFDSQNNGYYVVEREPGTGVDPTWTTWANTKYSLVLIFDEQNILQKHSQVEIMR